MYYIIIQKGSIHYTDYIVQSSAANSLRFIIFFSLAYGTGFAVLGGENRLTTGETKRERKPSVSIGTLLAFPRQFSTLWLLKEPHGWGAGYFTLFFLFWDRVSPIAQAEVQWCTSQITADHRSQNTAASTPEFKRSFHLHLPGSWDHRFTQPCLATLFLLLF